jgi:DMSO reductase anchor subunit
MLVLTQAGIGGIWFEGISTFFSSPVVAAQKVLSGILIFVGLGASILHLGRPLQAWRAFTGVRRSWLSREILAFNILSLSVLLHLAVEVLPLLSYRLAALVFCSLTGAAALVCSMMVYIDTPREFWRWPQTMPRFLGTTLLLGAGVAAIFNPAEAFLYWTIAAFGFGKLAGEMTIFRHLSNVKRTALRRTAKLMIADLSKVTAFRFCSLAGAAALSGLIFISKSQREFRQHCSSSFCSP